MVGSLSGIVKDKRYSSVRLDKSAFESKIGGMYNLDGSVVVLHDPDDVSHPYHIGKVIGYSLNRSAPSASFSLEPCFFSKDEPTVRDLGNFLKLIDNSDRIGAAYAPHTKEFPTSAGGGYLEILERK